MVVPLPAPPAPAQISDPRLREVSGMVPASFQNDLFWMIADSGNPAELYAVDSTGAVIGSFPVPGAENRDWEDLAATVIDGAPHLLVADTGNTAGRREAFQLYLFPEPALGGAIPADAVRRLDFTYADGARPDCEAVAVAPGTGVIYLVTKVIAGAATLYALPPPTAWLANGTAQALPAGPVPVVLATAMDIAPRGDRAVVLSYNGLYLFQRVNDRPWPGVFHAGAARRPLPPLPQAEAACFSRDGTKIHVTSELPAGTEGSVPFLVLEP
ncbi:MAG: hypothetical protein ABIF71_00460 [Planctomycetota bacterium]